MSASVSDIISVMEAIAPASLAEGWDNVGLQVGNPAGRVTKVHVALDASKEVVEAACSDGAQMLITHHPLIFAPLKRIDFSTSMGEIISRCTTAPLAIFSAHTNLDSAPDGLNEAFAHMIGLTNLSPLVLAEGANPVKLVFFIPESHHQKAMDVLFDAGAGTIGHYSGCSFAAIGEGTYLPGEDAVPYVGRSGELSREPELRVEVAVEERLLSATLKALKGIHPYETMEYNVYPMLRSAGADLRTVGLGRVGQFPEPMLLEDVVTRVKEAMGIPHIKLVGDPGTIIRRVAVCTGSGASLMKPFYASGADLYITGDLKYHEARDVEERGLAIMDAGHFETEHFVCTLLTKSLKAAFAERGFDVDVVPSTVEKPVFNHM